LGPPDGKGACRHPPDEQFAVHRFSREMGKVAKAAKKDDPGAPLLSVVGRLSRGLGTEVFWLCWMHFLRFRKPRWGCKVSMPLCAGRGGGHLSSSQNKNKPNIAPPSDKTHQTPQKQNERRFHFQQLKLNASPLPNKNKLNAAPPPNKSKLNADFLRTIEFERRSPAQ